MQQTLDELAAKSDSRVSVFEIQIKDLDHGTLSLSGRLLNEAQLTVLKEAFSRRFPDLSLDTASINILLHSDVPHLHVGTNITGLYEKPSFSVPLASELLYGWELEVLEEKDSWVFTRQTDGYLGWAYRPYLADGYAPKATHLVLAPSVELRVEPEVNSPISTRVVSGTGVTVIETSNGWARVAANQTGWMPAHLLRAMTDLPRSVEARRATLVEDSARMIGAPYLWGGLSGNGIDCSGFTYLLHRWIGIQIPRDADMQHAAAKPVEPPFEVGDLFFLAEGDDYRHVTHVGMSLGGWTMIHSTRLNNGVYVEDLENHPRRKALLSAGSFIR
jgi:hypothetical protein